MKKVELLAPAGNFEALKGAIYAGADAVYLGGEKYGARAYADNFTREQICQGIRMAHLYGRKLYLTVNTLLKDQEIDELYDFLLPYYECGLDGVIVQDLGAVCEIRHRFPDLPIHASTQMTITGSYGVRMLQEMGITRVVPSRELSLDEMKQMKEQTGIEIEAFIHGAMCYCYSGQCLFSSILGGRSGNRGRCAQPCRLPYQVNGGKEEYPLSMKDMCTIHMISELIDAGIDSFKIEGRMKKPVYAAGVTSIYRKYIDRYYEGNLTTIDKEDEKLLHSLYIRSEISEGYYHKKNGRDMITLDSPAYSKSDEKVLEKIEERYFTEDPIFWINAEVYLHENERAKMILRYADICITVEGALVCHAVKQPLTLQKVQEQMQKTGNTRFRFQNLSIHMDDEIFMTIRELNELRRNSIEELENRMIENHGLIVHREQPYFSTQPRDNPRKEKGNSIAWKGLHACVSTKEQFNVVLQCPDILRVYLETSLLEDSFVSEILPLREGKEYYIASPYVVRMHNFKELYRLKTMLQSGLFEGVLIRNTETYQYLKSEGITTNYILDHNMYCWNRNSVSFWKEKVKEFYLPIEENAYEWKRLLLQDNLNEIVASAMIYGRIPMMISANCVEKIHGQCRGETGTTYLMDRYGKEFPVEHNCKNCYNVIYNSVPLSLHSLFRRMLPHLSYGRLNFTIETAEETKKTVHFFAQLSKGEETGSYDHEFTTAHWKRGVE